MIKPYHRAALTLGVSSTPKTKSWRTTSGSGLVRRSFGRGCAVIGLLIGGVLASGCQSDGSSGSSEAVTVLTEEQLEEALLTLDNVGDDFREDTPQDPNDSPPLAPRRASPQLPKTPSALCSSRSPGKAIKEPGTAAMRQT